MEKPSIDSTVMLRQAYLVMFEYLEREQERLDGPEAPGAFLSNLALSGERNGQGSPIDAAVFPAWVADAACSSIGWEEATIRCPIVL